MCIRVTCYVICKAYIAASLLSRANALSRDLEAGGRPAAGEVVVHEHAQAPHHGGASVVDLNIELLGLHLRILVTHPEITGHVARNLSLGNISGKGPVEETPCDALHEADEEEDLGVGGWGGE